LITELEDADEPDNAVATELEDADEPAAAVMPRRRGSTRRRRAKPIATGEDRAPTIEDTERTLVRRVLELHPRWSDEHRIAAGVVKLAQLVDVKVRTVDDIAPLVASIRATRSSEWSARR